jgi:hypothetical protein
VRSGFQNLNEILMRFLIQFCLMATKQQQISGSKGTESLAYKRRGDHISLSRGSSPAAGWLRCTVAIVVLVVVAAIFIAPTIDLPDGVLRDHSAFAHANGSHSLQHASGPVKADASHTPHSQSETRATENRPPPGLRRAASLRPAVLELPSLWGLPPQIP